MTQSVFYLGGMCCGSEEGMIRKRLQSLPGVSQLKFNLLEHRLTVEHSLPDEQPLLVALEALGMQPRACNSPGASGPRRSRGFWGALALAGALAAASEALAFRGVPESDPLLVGMALLSMVLAGRETLAKAWLALRTLSFNINFLMSAAVLGAVAIGEWPEAAMVTFLFAVADLVEGYSLDRARHAIRALMELSPEKALVVSCCGHESLLPAEDVRLGAVVRVKPGDRIPLDGDLVSGNSAVNQAPITGESMPVEKGVGDSVFAGTINERGSFDFKVTASRGNTTLDRIVAAVQGAQSERAPTQRLVDRVAAFYTPAMLVVSLLIATVPPLALGAPALPWVYRALTLLVVACPCALVLSTPVTVVSGLAAAARAGILIKGGVYLESGRQLRAVALDKTGTLTVGRPRVTELFSLSDLPEDEVAEIATSLESRSEHPIASAVLDYWQSRRPLPSVEDFEALVGRGLRGRLKGRTYFVGSYRLVQEAGLATDAMGLHLERLEAEGKTVVFLMSDAQVLGLIAVADTIRESSVQAIKELRALGIEPLMLTGDNQKTAEAIATQVGISQVRGDLLPEDKLERIKETLAQYHQVGMVGDGINDAPALARSTIGFAMGAAGTATALETADVALMQDDLRRLPEFIKLSRQTARVLTQNIVFALGVKLVSFALTLTGNLTLWMAIFADMGASLLVITNGLRMLKYNVRQ